MKRIESRYVGIDQGSSLLFSDFEDDGPMWTGTGPREFRQGVQFAEKFGKAPSVQVHLSMWDMDQKTNARADVYADKITFGGFQIVFKTWGDTRIARVRANWMAIGPLADEDDWELY